MEASLASQSEHSQNRVAFLFPGQGSELHEAGRNLISSSAVARGVFEKADRVLGRSLSGLFLEGPEESLHDTRNLQPALFTFSVAILRVLEERTALRPFACLGHSLGEYAALVAARAVSFEDALACVTSRAEFMAEAAPSSGGGMAAVISLSRETIEEICTECAGEEVLQVANLNAPDQVVVSGHIEAMERAEPEFKRAGARAVIRLKVSTPFHSVLMRPAARRLEAVLEKVKFGSLEVPVLSNVTGEPHQTPERIRRLLVEQVASPVRWLDCMRWVLSRETSRFVELGPGGVLTGLTRRIDENARCVRIDRPEAIDTLEERLLQER
jgi:[acyl-carrier-protein] S-malonyltransferase